MSLIKILIHSASNTGLEVISLMFWGKFPNAVGHDMKRLFCLYLCLDGVVPSGTHPIWSVLLFFF